MGHVEVRVGLWNAGKAGIVRVAISDVVDRLLVGVATLETLGLTVDPLTGQLKESFYLMY
jgi:predicted aspartyl protease